MTQIAPENEARFLALLPEIRVIIRKRKGSWTLSTLPWEDVESILMDHIYRKIHQYDASRALDNWVNTVITRRLSNLLRDNLIKWTRPCLAANSYGTKCAFNTGGDTCALTPSGKQCSECKLFKRWQSKKGQQHNINASLSLEHHDSEVKNMPNDFIDIDACQKVIHEKMLNRLDRHEAKLYRFLFIQHLSHEETGKRMRYRKLKNNKVAGYQKILVFIKETKEEVRKIIAEENLA